MIEAWFKKHINEYLEFDKVSVKKSNRPDIHALLLLDEISQFKGNGRSILTGLGEDGMIHLDIDPDDLPWTEELVIELLRSGILFSDDILCIFV